MSKQSIKVTVINGNEGLTKNLAIKAPLWLRIEKEHKNKVEFIPLLFQNEAIGYALFSFDGLKLAVSKEGNVTLTGTNNDLLLVLKTDKIVTLSDKLACETLNIESDVILNRSEAYAKNIVFTGKTYIHNHGGIHATQKLSIKTRKGRIHNHENALITSKGDAEHPLTLMAGTLFHNEGAVHAEALCLFSENILLNALNAKITASKNMDCVVKKLICEGGLMAEGNMEFHVEHLFIGASGFIHSHNQMRIVNTGEIDNHGEIICKSDLFCRNAKNILTHPSSLIVSGNHAFFNTNGDIINQGIVGSKNWTGIQASNIKNGSQGALGGHGYFILEANHLLLNQGEISSGRLMSINAAKLINEALKSKIITQQDLSIHVLEALSNRGIIKAKGNAEFSVKKTFENYSGAQIVSEKSLSFHTDNLKNEGHIVSNGNLTISAKKTIENSKEAHIISNDKLMLVAKFAIENMGRLSGKDAKLFTTDFNALIKNCIDAAIITDNKLDIETQLILNEGILKTLTGDCTLKAETLFENGTSGSLAVAEGLIIKAIDGLNAGKLCSKRGEFDFKNAFKNSGLIQAEQELTLNTAATLWNLRSGQIQAKKALKLISLQRIISEGDILAFSSLSVLTHTLEQIRGQMESKQNITFDVVDLILGGNVKAGQDLVITIKNRWDHFQSGHFEAARTTRFNLDTGYTFTRPLYHKGSLEFHCLPGYTFHNLTTLTAEQDLTLSGGTVINGNLNGVFGRLEGKRSFTSHGTYFDNIYGGVFGGTELNIHHQYGIHNGRTVIQGPKLAPRDPLHNNRSAYRRRRFNPEFALTQQRASHWRTGNGSYLSSGGTATLYSSCGGFHNELAEVNIASDLSATLAGALVNDAGTIRIGQNADIGASHFWHQMQVETHSETTGYYHSGRKHLVQYSKNHSYAYALTDKPIFTVGGNCILATPVTARGGDIAVGKHLIQTQGGIDAQPIREFVYLSEASHLYDHGDSSSSSFHLDHTIALHSAHVSAHAGIWGMDKTARYNFGSGLQTNTLCLNFSELNMENDIFVKNAYLEGDVHSKVTITGKFCVEERLQMKAGSFTIQQPTVKTAVIAYDKDTPKIEFIESAIPNKGIVEAETAEIFVSNYTQIGGMLSSGIGGTILCVENQARVEALRTTELLQGNKGYSIAPIFEPAYMMSAGHQQVAVISGGFCGSGLVSQARGDNTIIARDDIDLMPKVEAYTIPAHQTGNSRHKQIIQGTTTSTLHNELMAGADVKVHSELGNVTIANSMIGSGRNSEFSGNSVTIKEKMVNECFQTENFKRTLFSFTHTKTVQTNDRALLSTLLVGGDLIIQANNTITLSGVQGLIQGNLKANAPLITIEGVKEKIESHTTTSSYGISFFGSNAIQALANKESSQKVLRHLMREHTFLAAAEQLSQAKDGAGLCIGTVQTFIEGWRVASMVAHACNAGDGVTGSIFGGFTDQLGLTTLSMDPQGQPQRTFNPTFRFQFGTGRQDTQQIRTTSSVLKVGESIEIKGDVIRLIDGTELSAKAIIITAQKLLEMGAAQNSYSSSSKSQGCSASVTLRDPALLSVGVNSSQSQNQGTLHKNAKLTATVSMDLTGGDSLLANGSTLQAPEMLLRGHTITFNSVQDSQQLQGKNWNVAVSLASPGGNVGYGQQMGNTVQTVQSAVHANNLRIEANTLIQTGSALVATNSIELQRADGQSGAVNHQVQHLQNTHTSRNTQINFGASNDSLCPAMGMATVRTKQKQGETLATVSAPHIKGQIAANVNQNAAQSEVTYVNDKSSIGVFIPAFNLERMNADKKAMQKAYHNATAPKISIL